MVSFLCVYICAKFQDAEYTKEIEDAYTEGLEIANSTEGWKKEKHDKETVRQASGSFELSLS